jgi:predicted transcriptional regulator
MTTDYRLQRLILETLCHLSGLALAETILTEEINRRLPSAASADAIRDQLALLKDSSLVEEQAGPLGEKRWRRTAQGEAAYRDLRG